MKPTNKALTFMKIAEAYMIDSAYNELLSRAREIAKERKATQLGYIHLGLALESMTKNNPPFEALYDIQAGGVTGRQVGDDEQTETDSAQTD